MSLIIIQIRMELRWEKNRDVAIIIYRLPSAGIRISLMMTKRWYYDNNEDDERFVLQMIENSHKKIKKLLAQSNVIHWEMRDVEKFYRKNEQNFLQKQSIDFDVY